MSGYLITRSFFYRPKIKTPSLVGKHLYEAFATLSNLNLTPRLLDQKEDPDLPEGTIIRQIPLGGQSVKERQTIFLVLSKKPPVLLAPNLMNQFEHNIMKKYSNGSFKLIVSPVESNYPTGQCIGQMPLPGKAIRYNQLIVYISKKENKPVIWPNFIGKAVAEVLEFLELYQIKPHIISYGSHRPSHRQQVIDQRPLAGSLITVSSEQPPYVQLHIQ